MTRCSVWQRDLYRLKWVTFFVDGMGVNREKGRSAGLADWEFEEKERSVIIINDWKGQKIVVSKGARIMKGNVEKASAELAIRSWRWFLKCDWEPKPSISRLIALYFTMMVLFILVHLLSILHCVQLLFTCIDDITTVKIMMIIIIVIIYSIHLGSK